jgi:hypothetical protein
VYISDMFFASFHVSLALTLIDSSHRHVIAVINLLLLAKLEFLLAMTFHYCRLRFYSWRRMGMEAKVHEGLLGRKKMMMGGGGA